ncbi:hypothetical protein KC19_11G136900 [Ceratodon purpureus]|uniref:fructose-bisphosphatase n=1 Tax=Ceratodon purpureus TaxID=3225 RepID=A0A8T0GG44_CERPU|nr:hypothetical protein KC19_11G136900 [Ceratodon purpureus]
MNYFFLFCICFLPLLSFRWTRVGDLPSKAEVTPPAAPAKEIKPPSPSAVARVLGLLRKTKPVEATPSFFQQPLHTILASGGKAATAAASASWFAPPARRRKPAEVKPPPAEVKPRPTPLPPPSPPPFIRPPVPTSHHYAVARADADEVVTMTAFLGTEGSNVDVDLVVLMTHLQAACKHIASILASPTELQTTLSKSDFMFGVGRDAPKPLAVVSNNIIKAALRSSGKVAAIASEEDERPVWLGEGPYVVVFDPLDGSRNIDASIPTGTIFGIYRRLPETDYLPTEEKAYANVMQRGERMVAAGYALYSASTLMAISVGSGLHGFSLDYTIGEFVYSHHDIRIPERGQIYSVNEAKYFDWPAGLRRYIDNIRQGKGQTRRHYSARFICSLVADLHRTIMYGGILMNPKPHLKLMYEANPLSYLVEQGGGKGTDGKRRILEINPIEIHQRLPLFLGSAADVSELVSYGDIQQQRNPGVYTM